jgi:DNA-binding NarL/FixJ family response regulator
MKGGSRAVDYLADAEGRASYEAPMRDKEHSTKLGVDTLSICLIDGDRFTLDCISEAFLTGYAGVALRSFATVESFLSARIPEFDIVIYHSHEADLSGPYVPRAVSAIRRAFPTIPLVILSGAKDAQHPRTIRTTLRCGANGIIDTRTTCLATAVTVIRFVSAGGTHAPLGQLLSAKSDHLRALSDEGRTTRLTPRQEAVLSHLLQGKANKLIAYELGMSESTTKVHVRNIMRKLGATNRTQAVYKAHSLWDGAELAEALVR